MIDVGRYVRKPTVATGIRVAHPLAGVVMWLDLHGVSAWTSGLSMMFVNDKNDCPVRADIGDVILIDVDGIDVVRWNDVDVELERIS